MFILFGAKTVKTPVKNGLSLRKRCDRCQFLSDLREHGVRRYFTLFFIPVFPISKAETLLVCNRCEASFYIQPANYLGSQTGSSSDAASAENKSSTPDEEKLVIVCEYCQGRLRIPMTSRRLLVTCPHCKKEMKV